MIYAVRYNIYFITYSKNVNTSISMAIVENKNENLITIGFFRTNRRHIDEDEQKTKNENQIQRRII